MSKMKSLGVSENMEWDGKIGKVDGKMKEKLWCLVDGRSIYLGFENLENWVFFQWWYIIRSSCWEEDPNMYNLREISVFTKRK